MFTVLVTGGLGFIGSHVCISLLESGYRIIIVDSLINSYESILDNIYSISKQSKLNPDISFSKLDINNRNDLENLFIKSINSGKRINAIFHFAGLKSVNHLNCLINIGKPM